MRTSKKCTEIKKARGKHAKLLYLLIKYAKLWRCRCPRVVDLKLANDLSPKIELYFTGLLHEIGLRYVINLFIKFSTSDNAFRVL